MLLDCNAARYPGAVMRSLVTRSRVLMTTVCRMKKYASTADYFDGETGADA
jgi:hypothetical protein